MKKILFSIILFIFMCIPVYADSNKIYFTESDKRIYYQDYDGTFLKHLEMLPGEEYNDTLEIENNTKEDYKLFLKFIDKNESNQASELLDNLEMKIYLDDNLIYEGNSKGLIYQDGDYILDDVITIGNMKPKSEHILKVITKLSDNYTNKDNNELSYLNWVFFAQYGNKGDIKPIDKNPKTNDNLYTYIFISIISLLSIILGIVMKKKLEG